MTRLRRLAARISGAVQSADGLATAGIACLTIGAGLAWLPAGFLLLGACLIIVARYGAEES